MIMNSENNAHDSVSGILPDSYTPPTEERKISLARRIKSKTKWFNPKRRFFIMIMTGNILALCAVAVVLLSNNAPYYDDCSTLAKNFIDLTSWQCVEYMNEYPGSTGQAVVEYYDALPKSTLNELLTEPLSP